MRVETCELDTINTQPLPTQNWFVFKLAFLFFFSPAGWHQFHFPLLLVNCYCAFTSLMNLARLCGASLSYVKWTWTEIGVESVTRQLPVCKSRCLVCTLTSSLEMPGPPCCFSAFTGWIDESLVLSQGNLSVCPVWGRPAAWLEEESRISANSSRDQAGSRLLQQNRNRYCSAWRIPEDVPFSCSFNFCLFFNSGQGDHRAGLVGASGTWWCRNPW